MVLEKFIVCTLLITIAPAIALNTQRPCQKRETKYGYVCVCDVNYCDTLDVPEPKINEYILTTSSKAGDRFSYVRGNLTQNNSASDLHLEVDPLKRHQKINGFGGGYTGSVAYLIDQISSKLQNYFYDSYFSKTVGMGYSFLRIPIGGSDMDLKIWAYNERPVNDTNLSNFTKLDRRDLTRNEQLKQMAKVSKNTNVKLLAAAWTPPPWMKAKGNSWMASVSNQILPKYYQTWADYHVKWLDLMKKDNMNIWAISTGNEPQSSKTNVQFPETYWDVDKHAEWIGDYLGPTMRRSKFSQVEIHGLDDNRVYAIDWLDKLQKTNKKALDYLSAIDIHGYSDKSTRPELLDELRRKYPAKEIYYTEMCFGIPGYAVLGSWNRGASLAKILMQNLNHSTNGYFDWNLVLNSRGGPNNGNLKLDAPILLSENMTEMYKQPMFYVLAHFSRFIPPGSVRIQANLMAARSSDVLALAFQRPDKRVTVVAFNDATSPVRLAVNDKLMEKFNVQLKPMSINTLCYNDNALRTGSSL